MPRKNGFQMKDILTKDILYDLYIIQDISTVLIAKKYGCTDSTVGNLLKKYNIPTKERRKLKNVLNREQLYDLYINKDMTTYEIGELVRFDDVSVQRLLKEYGIPKKKQLSDIITKDALHDLYSIKKLPINEISEIYNCCKNSINNLINKYNLGQLHLSERLSKEVLYNLYIKENKRIIEIANLFRCRASEVAELINNYNMRKELLSEKLKKEISKEELFELYITENLSMADIGVLYDCSYQTIGRLLDEYEIPRKEILEDNLSKEELERLYVTNTLSTYEIAEIYNCTAGAVSHLLRKYGIKTRSVNDYINFGHMFESIVKEVFEVLKLGYMFKTLIFEGIIPDFYDKKNDIILDAKLSSYTPFIRLKNGTDFFERYKGYSDKVIIVYLRGNQFDPIHNFEWRHVSYYYPKLIEFGREDLIEKLNELQQQLNNIINQK